MVPRAASILSLRIMIRAVSFQISPRTQPTHHTNWRLTRFGEEEQEERLSGRGQRSQAHHPAPPAVHICECRVNTVRNNLSAGDHDDIHDDHASAQAGRGEFLDVQRRDTCGDAYTDSDEETAANLPPGSTLR